MTDPIFPGSIIIASVLDESGRNPKSRPLLVVSVPPEDELAVCVCVSITSTWESVPEAFRVMLPFQSDKKLNSKTGLRLKSAAHCGWLNNISLEQVITVKGRCPKMVFEEILLRLPTKPPQEDVR